MFRSTNRLSLSPSAKPSSCPAHFERRALSLFRGINAFENFGQLGASATSLRRGSPDRRLSLPYTPATVVPANQKLVHQEHVKRILRRARACGATVEEMLPTFLSAMVSSDRRSSAVISSNSYLSVRSQDLRI
jgi:hypothetical protein